MKAQNSTETDYVCRSLLQKAVRRGNTEVVEKACLYLIQNGDFDWLRKRLAVVTFEECWTYGAEISYEKDEAIVVGHFLKLAKAVKNKDAAGLGSLALALANGDKTVLSGDAEANKTINILAAGIARPADFWVWALREATTAEQKLLIANAVAASKKAGWAWDKAFTQAAALLAVSNQIPPLNFLERAFKFDDFPFCVGIDKHTLPGKIAIKESARRAGINEDTALMLSFYCVGGNCSALENSLWWEKEIAWKLKRAGISSIRQAHEIWSEIAPLLINLLSAETALLKQKLLSVKRADVLPPEKQLMMF